MSLNQNSTFIDSKLEAQFRKRGFVVVDLLDTQEFQALKDAMNSFRSEQDEAGPNQEASYKLSFFIDNPSFRKKIFDKVSGMIQPLLDKYLNQFEPLMVNTFDKEPGSGEVPVHQNWTFVDEAEYRSVSVWIPLVDVTKANGTMELVPGSQTGVSAVRGPLIPWVFSDLTDAIKEKYMVPLNLQTGQAAIIDDAIIHYTSQNDTNEVRGSVQIIAKPKSATAIHYHKPSEDADHLEVFEVNSDFFQRFKMYSRPEGVPKLKDLPYTFTPLREDTLSSLSSTALQ